MKHIKSINELRNVGKMYSTNDGNRSISESIVVREVELAFKDWISVNPDCVLIGGIALSFYVIPRYTMDVDVLFISDSSIPTSVPNFKHHRVGAFQHNKTHVEIETFTPQSINIPVEFAQAIFDTSKIFDGIKVASPSGLVALKLGRFSLHDQGDIEQLINYTDIDLSPFNLPDLLVNRYEKFKESLR
jgi:hypothetical protein